MSIALGLEADMDLVSKNLNNVSQRHASVRLNGTAWLKLWSSSTFNELITKVLATSARNLKFKKGERGDETYVVKPLNLFHTEVWAWPPRSQCSRT